MAEANKRPEVLPYEPTHDGLPPQIFTHSQEPSKAVCPVSLPASGITAYILRTREGAVTALTSPYFSVAQLEDTHAVTGAVCQDREGLLRLDKPDVTALRRVMGPFFSEQHVDKWRPDIQDASLRLSESIKDTPQVVDLNEAFSEPFIAEASRITAGIPAKDWPRLRELSDATLSLIETSEDTAVVREAWSELYKYCKDFINDKREHPDDAILSKLVGVFDQQKMTEDQLVHVFATVINGFPTPTAVLNVCALELMRRPEAVAECIENNSWKATVDELMRYRAHFASVLPRIALRDVSLENHHIPAGSIVLPSLLAAAKDPAHAESPDTFDINQRAPRRIVFGAGSHFCPGAPLTRQWLSVAMENLFTTLPNLRLAIPDSDLRWQKGMLPVPETIPVMWDR